MGSKERSTKHNRLLLVAIGLAHVGITALTWHDIRSRPQDQVRGGPRLWRVLSAANTIGSAGYWLVGRRR